MLLTLLAACLLLSQDAAPPVHPTAPPPTPSPAATPNRAFSQAELENQFKESLTGVALTGTFRMVGKGMGREEPTLSEPIAERYEIVKVSKILDDSWLVEARIQYGQRDVTVPVTVRVLWAGDTPVITLDRIAIPLIGTYSARVMIYNGYYSGMWFGDGYGGIMSGQITKAPGAPPAAPPGATPSVPAPTSPSQPVEAPRPASAPPARPQPAQP